MLFCPSVLWRGERLVFAGSRADDGAFVVDDEGSCAAGTNVNS
jgi:hypothetical protein